MVAIIYSSNLFLAEGGETTVAEGGDLSEVTNGVAGVKLAEEGISTNNAQVHDPQESSKRKKNKKKGTKFLIVVAADIYLFAGEANVHISFSIVNWIDQRRVLKLMR